MGKMLGSAQSIAATSDASAATAAALTDSSGGTASQTLAANAGRVIVPFWISLPTIADGDLITNYTPGFAGKVLSIDFITDVAVTTAAKTTALHCEIGAVATTGGVLTITSAAATPKGAEIAGTAITAANSFTAAETLSLVAASTTTFVEGTGWVVLTLENSEIPNALASIADEVNALITDVASARTQVNALLANMRTINLLDV